MPPVDSVGERKKTTMDRLSNLPPNVTQKILECLPLRDAARTSILSSHWKHQWTSISQLVLDQDFFRNILGRKLQSDISLAYSKAVCNILLSLTGPICKFDLYFPYRFPREVDLNRWIQYARDKGVKELTLDDDDRDRERDLPTCLFSCVGLTSLTLMSYKLVSLPPTFNEFPCLVTLKLDCRFAEMKLLELLISKCPLLRTLFLLEILPVVYDLNLHVHAPKLKNLLVTGFLDNLYLKETSGILSLALNISCFRLQNSRYISEFFSCVVNVERLALGNYVWMQIKRFEIPGVLPKQLERLQSLRLVAIPLECHSSMRLAVCLISSSPFLEQLYIESDGPSSEEDSGDGPSFQIDELCNLQHLKNIQLVGISGLSNELQLIKFLLASSPVLAEMSIVLTAEMGGAEDIHDFSKESLQYCRASPHAKIIISTEDHFCCRFSSQNDSTNFIKQRKNFFQ